MAKWILGLWKLSSYQLQEVDSFVITRHHFQQKQQHSWGSIVQYATVERPPTLYRLKGASLTTVALSFNSTQLNLIFHVHVATIINSLTPYTMSVGP